MAYFNNEPESILTLGDALQQCSVDDLKKLAALASDEKGKPTRKPDLIAFIQRQVESDPLQRFWRKLDTL